MTMLSRTRKGDKKTSHLSEHKWDFSLKCLTNTWSHLSEFWEEKTSESSYSFAEKCVVFFFAKYGYIYKYIILYCDDATLKWPPIISLLFKKPS